MAEQYFHTNEIIFQKGDASNFAYLILAGKVEILRDFPENPLQLAVLGEGKIFGEMGLLDQRPRSLTARALDETKLLVINREGFISLLRNHPDKALAYLRMFFDRLQAMNTRLPNENLPPKEKQIPKRWNIKIFPLTSKAEVYIPQTGYQMNTNLLRVGRSAGGKNDLPEINDFILQDSAPYNVSRNHFSIQKMPEKVIVQDTGSFLGTIVNGKPIGANHHSSVAELVIGDNEIVVGSPNSPYKFKVVVRVQN